MIIVIESPYKAPRLKAILRALKIDAQIVSTRGRLFDLPVDSFGITDSLEVSSLHPVDPDHFSAIQEDLLDSNLCVCTDPDDEGDFIAWTIATYRAGKKTMRAAFQELTLDEVRRSLASATAVSLNPPHALARRLFDRMLGYSSNDGMFLSRTAGAVLGAAAQLSIPTKKIIESVREKGRILYSESYEGHGGKCKTHRQEEGFHDLPSLAHCYHLAPEIGVTPSEIFRSLQSLYADAEISYFRTTSTALNQAAGETLRRIEDESGFENLARISRDANAGSAHPGIYSTRYLDSPPDRTSTRRRREGLDEVLRRRIFNATLFAMAGQETRSITILPHNGEAYRSISADYRGDTYSYPLTRVALDEDIISGEPKGRPGKHSYSLHKETGIALTLINMGVGHPSSWASLANRYCCFLTKNGTLSERGGDFLYKHQLEAPMLLEPQVAVAIEATLLDPSKTIEQKMTAALALADIPEARFERLLSPSRSADPESIFRNPGPSL